MWLLLGVEEGVVVKQQRTKGQKNEENNKNYKFVRRCSLATCPASSHTRKRPFMLVKQMAFGHQGVSVHYRYGNHRDNFKNSQEFLGISKEFLGKNSQEFLRIPRNSQESKVRISVVIRTRNSQEFLGIPSLHRADLEFLGIPRNSNSNILTLKIP